jgi:hypothetical protein
MLHRSFAAPHGKVSRLGSSTMAESWLVKRNYSIEAAPRQSSLGKRGFRGPSVSAEAIIWYSDLSIDG